MDIYRDLVNYCRRKNPARCWFDYPPTYLLSKKISFNSIKKSIGQVVDSKKKCGLYVNIPFCRTRCLYCMYYSEILSDTRKIDLYLKALEKEIKSYHIDFKKRKFSHLYIGGGTPLLLNSNQLNRLFGIIYRNFKFTSDSQFVIEGRPGDFTLEKTKILAENKINRVTLGIQSFNKKTLRKIRRDHTIKQIEDAFKKIRKNGISYINVDIIVGLPGETLVDYRNTVERLIKLAPDCISCTRMLYGDRVMIMEQDQMTDKKINSDYVFFDRFFRENNYLPIKDKEGVYLKNGCLEANNKLLFENLNSASFIFGIGSRAISYLPNVRYASNKVDDYISSLSNTGKTNYYGMFMNKDDIMREYIILQLYLFRKIKLKDFVKKFRIGLLDIYKVEMSNLKKNKIITFNKEEELFFLTDKTINLNDFFYNIIKYLYKGKYIKEMLKMLKEAKI